MNHIEFFEKYAFDFELTFETRNILRTVQTMKLEEATLLATLVSAFVRYKNDDNAILLK